MDNLDVRLLSVENEALLHAISPHSSFSPFKNVCERLWISMYRGPAVTGL